MQKQPFYNAQRLEFKACYIGPEARCRHHISRHISAGRSKGRAACQPGTAPLRRGPCVERSIGQGPHMRKAKSRWCVHGHSDHDVIAYSSHTWPDALPERGPHVREREERVLSACPCAGWMRALSTASKTKQVPHVVGGNKVRNASSPAIQS